MSSNSGKQATTISDSQCLQNKYVYPEFAGFEGERLLRWVLVKILPMALYRTWEIFSAHQAPGNDCFLSLSKVAEISGRGERTIRLSMKELTARGLMTLRSERKLLGQGDGSVRMHAVIVKDFSRLYSLAHEYLEWTASESYVAPDRELADLIRSDEALVRKLLRFHNYRRILTNKVPGPKPQPKEEHLWFNEYEAKSAEDAPECTDRKEFLQKDLQEDLKVISQNRIITSDQKDHLDGYSFYSKDSQKRRADGYRKDSHETEVVSPSISEETRTNDEEPKSTSTEETKARLIARSLGAKGGTGAKAPENRPARNEMVAAFVREVSPALCDRNPKSSLTYAQRLVEGTVLSQKEILACLVKAYLVAFETKRVRAQHRHPEGDNRMPIFCKMLGDLITQTGAGVFYCDDEHLAADIASDDRLVLFVVEHRLEEMLLGEDSPEPEEEVIVITEAPAGEPPVEARDEELKQAPQEEPGQACEQTLSQGRAACVIEVEDPAFGWSTYETAEWMGTRMRESLGERSYSFACFPTQHGRHVVVLYERGGDIEDGWLFGTTDQVREYL